MSLNPLDVPESMDGLFKVRLNDAVPYDLSPEFEAIPLLRHDQVNGGGPAAAARRTGIPDSAPNFPKIKTEPGENMPSPNIPILIDLGVDSESEESDLEEQTNHDEYETKFWPSRENPTGGLYRSNTLIFANSMLNIKDLLKKGVSKKIDNYKFRVLDTKQVGATTDVILEITDDIGKGKAAVVFSGPNKTKCSIQVKKIKNNDSRFVKIISKSILEPILNGFIAGDGNKFTLPNSTKKKLDFPFPCELCNKKYKTDGYLKAHMRRIHNFQENTNKKRKFNTKDSVEHVKIPNLHSSPKSSKVLNDKKTVVGQTITGKENSNLSESKIQPMEVDSDVDMSSHQNIKPVPEFCKPFVNEDDQVLVVPSDGACGPHCAAAHIYGNLGAGQILRRHINTHISQNRQFYESKIEFPYSRQVGVQGKVVHFNTMDEYLEYLTTSDDAVVLWTGFEELLAIANMFQMKIKVITISNNIVKKVSQIGPHPEFQGETNLTLPALKEMVVLHYDEAHFNLIISKDSVFNTNLVNSELFKNTIKSLKNEIDEIKKSHSELLQAYNEKEKNVKQLEIKVKHCESNHKFVRNEGNLNKENKSQFKNSMENNIDQKENKNEDLSEKLNRGKKYESVKAEEIPNSKVNIKTFQCDICKKTFAKKSSMDEHTLTHDDGDWTCHDCLFQTNSKSNLEIHVKRANHPSSNILAQSLISCKLCDKTFRTNDDLKAHRISNHKSFKPCNNLQNCKFQDGCIFNHNQLKESEFICYQCGNIYTKIEELMSHRKASHEMKLCMKYKNNTCRFDSDKCWFSHQSKETNSDKKYKTPASQSEKQNQVFWEAPVNLAPPSWSASPPNMDIWTKMTTICQELTKLLTTLQANQSQS